MASQFGHGSEKGGIFKTALPVKICNEDGSGIDFKNLANGDEWRWTEQWIPHAAWFFTGYYRFIRSVILPTL